jgi:hypothetical protein
VSLWTISVCVLLSSSSDSHPHFIYRVFLHHRYEEMKAVVPLPMLRYCVDHMVAKPNYNLTGESKASDEYNGTIRVDKGKNSNNTFYSIAKETVTKKLIFDTLQEFACPVTIEEL